MVTIDEIAWYPLRITYSQEMKVKEYLDKEHIESFIKPGDPAQKGYGQISSGNGGIVVHHDRHIHMVVYILVERKSKNLNVSLYFHLRYAI